MFRLILISLTLLGCTVQKTVYYETDNISKNLSPSAQKKSICILQFIDIRHEVAGNDIYLTKAREIFENNKTYCINSEQHYKKNPVSTQMTMMLADHLQKRGTFKNVYINKKDSADFVIECKLARITSKQHLPESIKVGPVAGGLIGAAAVSFIKSKNEVSFALTDVKIYDNNMNLLVELGSFANDYEEETHPDASCWCAYNNVKTNLKKFYTDFIYQLENRIEEL